MVDSIKLEYLKIFEKHLHAGYEHIRNYGLIFGTIKDRIRFNTDDSVTLTYFELKSNPESNPELVEYAERMYLNRFKMKKFMKI